MIAPPQDPYAEKFAALQRAKTGFAYEAPPSLLDQKFAALRRARGDAPQQSPLNALAQTEEFRAYMQRRGLAEVPGPRSVGESITHQGLARRLPFIGTGLKVADTGSVLAAGSRISEGKGTDEDWDTFFDYIVEQQRGSTFLGGAADIVADLPGFMGEIVTGAGILSKLGGAAAKGAGKLALGKMAGEVTKNLLAKSMAARAAAQVGMVVGGAIGTAEINEGILNTFGPGGRMELSALQRSMPGLAVLPDGGGRLHAHIVESDRTYESQRWAGRLDTWIEYLSERMGGALGRITGLSFLQAKAAERIAKGLGIDLAGDVSLAQYNKLVQATRKATWWHGPVEEILEERFGDVLRAGTGIGEWGDVWPGLEQLAQEALAFSVPGAAVALGAKGIQIAQGAGQVPPGATPSRPGADQQPPSDAPAPSLTIGPEAAEALRAQGVESMARQAGVDPGTLTRRAAQTPAEEEAVAWAAKRGLDLGFVEGLPEGGPRAVLPGEGVALIRAGLAEGADPGGVLSAVMHEGLHDVLKKRPEIHGPVAALVESIDPKAYQSAKEATRALYEGELGRALGEAELSEETLAGQVETLAPWVWWAQASQANRAQMVEALRNDRTLLQKVLDALRELSNRFLGTGLRTTQMERLERLQEAVGRPVTLAEAQVAAVLSEALDAALGPVLGVRVPSQRPFVGARPAEAPQSPQDRAEPPAAREPGQEAEAQEAQEEAAKEEPMPLYEGMSYGALNRAARDMGLSVPDRRRSTLEAALRERFEQRQAEDRAMREARRQERLRPAQEARATEPRADRPRRQEPTAAEQAAQDFDEGVGDYAGPFALDWRGDAADAQIQERFALAPQVDSEAFKRWFGDSEVVDRRGKPRVFYHGTDASERYSVFRRLSHFGTYKAANQRVSDRKFRASRNQRVLPVYLAISNPLILPDRGLDDAVSIAQAALLEGVITAAEAGHIIRGAHVTGDFVSDSASTVDELIKVLTAQGYDGIRYTNRVEDAGSDSYVAFSPTQIKSATGNVGAFDPQNPDIRFALRRIPLPKSGNYFQTNVPEARSRDAIYSYWVNQEWGQERVVKALKREDINILARLRKGRTRQRVRIIERSQERIVRATKRAVIAIEFVSDWLYATHAHERNAEMAKRNPNQQILDALVAQVDFKRRVAARAVKGAEKALETLRAQKPQNKELVKKSRSVLAAARRTKRELDKERARLKSTKPFSGTEEERNRLSGMSNAEADKILAEATEKGWDVPLRQIRAIRDSLNRRTRRGMVEDGLLKQSEADAWERLYPNYMPLRTFNEDEMKLGTGRGFDIRGKESQRALGRLSKADNPLAFLFMQAEVAAIRGEKNRVGQALLEMAEKNPDPTLWVVQPVQSRRDIDPKTGFVTTVSDTAPKDNDIHVKRGGETVLITVHPSNMAFANAFNQADAEHGNAILQALATWTRWFAAMATRWNPFFAPFNLARDAGHGTITAMAEEGYAIGGEILRGLPGAFRAMLDMQLHPNRPVGAGAPKASVYAHEYRDAGGMIAFLDLDNYQERVKALERFAKSGPTEGFFKALQGMAEVFGAWNDAAENSTRLSYYIALRERGFTPDQAAAKAKDLTTNFERGGNARAWLNGLWAFSNAGIQGIDRVARAFKHPRMWKLAGASMAGAGLLAFYNLMAGGDDEDGVPFYWKIPEYVKAQGQVFMLPGTGGDYVVVPLPWVYRWIHNAGRHTAEVAMGGKSVMDAATAHVGAALDEFVPLGGGGDPLTTITPTIVRPVLEGARNEDWTGRSIRPTKFPSDVRPMSETHWPDPTPSMKWIARIINQISGGDEVTPGAVSISPDVIEHVLRGYLPGVGAETLRIVASLEKLGAGTPMSVNDVPLVRRAYKTASPFRHGTAFREHAETVRRAVLRIEAARDTGDLDRLMSAQAAYGAVARLDGLRRTTEARLRKLKARLKQAEEGSEVHAAISDQIKALQIRFNARYYAALDPPLAVESKP